MTPLLSSAALLLIDADEDENDESAFPTAIAEKKRNEKIISAEVVETI